MKNLTLGINLIYSYSWKYWILSRGNLVNYYVSDDFGNLAEVSGIIVGVFVED